MAIVIKPKRSETASSAPTVSDLAVGEIAINTADSKLYIRDSSDNIKSIGGGSVIQFPYDDTDLGDLSSATQNSDLGSVTGSVSYPDGNYDNLTVHTSLTVNGTEITGSGIALTDLSVGGEGAASGDGGIAYNNTTGVFTYTPPDLSSYLTSETFTELSQDTTPQLGGDLDLNSNDITGTGNINIQGTVTQGSSTYYTSQYVLHGTTTNATETEILTVGDSARIPVATDTTLLYEVSIVARRTDATGESASWHLKGCADNFSGTVADVGSVYEIAVAQDDVALAVDVRADNTNNAINVFVTGAASKTIRWTAIVKTTEVAE